MNNKCNTNCHIGFIYNLRVIIINFILSTKQVQDGRVKTICVNSCESLKLYSASSKNTSLHETSTGYNLVRNFDEIGSADCAENRLMFLKL